MKLDKNYFEKGEASLKKELEGDEEMFNRWVSPDGDYVLVTEIRGEGEPTRPHYYCVIGSKTWEELEQLFKTSFFQLAYETTTQHFIADIKNKKIIKFLSVCM